MVETFPLLWNMIVIGSAGLILMVLFAAVQHEGSGWHDDAGALPGEDRGAEVPGSHDVWRGVDARGTGRQG